MDSERVHSKLRFQCVLCESPLREGSEGVLNCSECNGSYPLLAGIRILHVNPDGLLRAHLDEISESSGDGGGVREPSPSLQSVDAMARAIQAHLVAGARASDENRRALKELSGPIEEYLARRPAEESLLARFSLPPNRWPFKFVLPYLYRDWSGTEEASFIASVFRAAIEDYGAGAREVVAVVGCGGSGLLYELSPLFEETAGVDISIPALLFAGRLLRGGELTLSFNFPSDRVPLEQTTVRLKGPKPRPSPIHLVAADASRLPFADASVSCVASQYLLDLMPDQRSLAAELHRVLVPGGLWLSFGLPGGLTSEDAAAHVDLSGFFSGVGFDLVKASRERCTHLDMSSLSRWRGTAIHCNEFAVWRKNPSTTGGRERAFADYFSGRGDSILRRQPSRSDRITISIASQRRFKAKSVDAVMRLAIHAGSEDLLALDLPAEAAGFLDEFFERIDGKRTIREIVESLRTTLGEFIHEKEIVLLIRTLCELGLLRVSVAPD